MADANEPPPPYEVGDYGSDHKGPTAPPTEPYQNKGAPPAGPPTYVAGYIPVGPTGTTTTVIVSQPFLGPDPIQTSCPNCQAQMRTEITITAGTLTWLICILLAVFGLWCGCCLIPFCINECQDVEHRCPNCKHFLGVYKRL